MLTSTRRRLCKRNLLLAMLGMTAYPVSGMAQANVPITGVPWVIDGDTLSFGRVHVRLRDIDAPELSQGCTDSDGKVHWCGLLAKDFLKQLIGQSSVTCDPVGKDKYGRFLAHCSINNQDIGGIMVEAGWAVVYRGHSSELMEVQNDASRHHNGIWQWAFEWPWVWREQKRARQ
jgi:endonuclease YncB( thermonuclease family)